ncbi:hypothetical protein NIES2104_65930 [Leptolyngbya sp. NIES-2104]|nr:hypothetical protein NIES2104_65930 [Leptolyngbya sp. NIES-2104]
MKWGRSLTNVPVNPQPKAAKHPETSAKVREDEPIFTLE